VLLQHGGDLYWSKAAPGRLLRPAERTAV
jgi:hypothetical protein